VVFPSLEAFEQRLNLPAWYWLFFDNFIRAAVGDDCFKGRARMVDVVNRVRMVKTMDEAFACVLLKNNYHAWLVEGKEDFGGMLCDYDDPSLLAGKQSLVEYLLRDRIIEAVKVDHTTTYVVVVDKTVGEEGEDNYVPSPYPEAINRFNEAHAAIREKARETNAHLKHAKVMSDRRAIAEQRLSDDSVTTRKRRKLLHDMKVYTTQQGDERAFRGWSSRAYADLVDSMKVIRGEGDELLEFEKKYRLMYQHRHRAKTKVVKDAIDEDLYDELWSFDNANEPVMEAV
jgi:hypothetical protein